MSYDRALALSANDLRELADIMESIQAIRSTVNIRTIDWQGRTLTLSRSVGHQLDSSEIRLDHISTALPAQATSVCRDSTGAKR